MRQTVTIKYAQHIDTRVYLDIDGVQAECSIDDIEFEVDTGRMRGIGYYKDGSEVQLNDLQCHLAIAEFKENKYND